MSSNESLMTWTRESDNRMTLFLCGQKVGSIFFNSKPCGWVALCHTAGPASDSVFGSLMDAMSYLEIEAYYSQHGLTYA